MDPPFIPRFLLLEIIFAHSPYDDLAPNQPRLQENLLCRADWLYLRGIAATECAILPMRELATYPRCSVCEHPAQGCTHRRVGPCRHGSLSTNSVGSQHRCLGVGAQADSPCSGRTDSIYDSEPNLRKWNSDVAGNCCPRVPGPVPHPAGTIPAAAPSPRAYPPSLPIRSSPHHSWLFPHQIRLALPQERGSRMPSVSSLWFRPLSTTDGGALNEGPLFVGQNINRLSINLTLIQSAQRSHHPCPQHFGSVFRSTVTSPISRACGKISCCAGRTGFSCEGLQNQSVQSYPSKNSPLFRGAVRANISAQESASRRAGPCQRRTGAVVSKCRHGLQPLLRTYGQYLRVRTSTLGVGPRHGWSLLPECARTSAAASAYCTVQPRYLLLSPPALAVRFSLDGPPTDVTSPSSTGSLSGAP